MKVETRFEKPGTLLPPGPIGRLVRLVLGLWISYLFIQLAAVGLQALKGSSKLIGWSAPTHPSWWLAVLLCFWAFPYVINIGWTKNWRRKPQWLLLVVVAVLVVIGSAQRGSLWSPALGGLILVWMLYVSAHLGFAMILAAILATPGCEMRAFHHLWTRVSERETKEHYCPGFLDKLDKWELSREKLQKVSK